MVGFFTSKTGEKAFSMLMSWAMRHLLSHGTVAHSSIVLTVYDHMTCFFWSKFLGTWLALTNVFDTSKQMVSANHASSNWPCADFIEHVLYPLC